MIRRATLVVCLALLVTALPRPALAQKSAAELLGQPATPEGELSLRKDPSERYRLGYGVVVTAGIDSQKNHSLGIFRDIDDQGPLFRNTAKYDLVEAYASYLIPLGTV